MRTNDHTFCVLAYRESPYLEKCIYSLMRQTKRSEIIISTSTPSPYIQRIAKNHGLDILVNEKSSGIASDWSFAYKNAKTRYVTLAHQDDIYYPGYTEACLNFAERYKNNLITFTGYHELLESKTFGFRLNLIIKKLILTPFFLFGRNLSSRPLKSAILSLGSPISCPSVMYNKEKIGRFEFSEDFQISLDWDAWLRLADESGDFVFIGERLMAHRIYESSETSRGIGEKIRMEEDLAILRRIWGDPIGIVMAKIYALSYRSNR